jgi:hypothetical protein
MRAFITALAFCLLTAEGAFARTIYLSPKQMEFHDNAPFVMAGVGLAVAAVAALLIRLAKRQWNWATLVAALIGSYAGGYGLSILGLLFLVPFLAHDGPFRDWLIAHLPSDIDDLQWPLALTGALIGSTGLAIMASLKPNQAPQA